MVNDCLVCFNKVLEMVLNSSLNVTLSPNSIESTPKKPMPELTPRVMRQAGHQKATMEPSQRSS